MAPAAGMPDKESEHVGLLVPVHGLSIRILRAGMTALLLAACVAVGHALFFSVDANLALAPLIGVTAALTLRRPADSAAAAFLGVVLGTELATVLSSTLWEGPEYWVGAAFVSAAIAALVALAVALIARRRPAAGVIASALVMLLLLGGLWSAVFIRASVTRSPSGTLVQELEERPRFAPRDSDGKIFVAVLRRLEERQPYYPAFRSALIEANRGRAAQINLDTPFSYRLPTFYWALSLFSESGVAVIAALTAFASVTVIAAYLLALEFVPVAGALLGATAVASLFLGTLSGPALLDTEPWAGALGLIFALGFVMSRRRERHRFWFVFMAISAAVLSALVRELGVAFLLVGIVGTLADSGERRLRRVAPWTCALIGVLIAYALHFRAAIAMLEPASGSSHAAFGYWLQPFGASLASVVIYAGRFMTLNAAVTFVILALGLAGSLIGPDDVASRVVLACIVVGGSLALLFLGPSGVVSNGVYPPQWGGLVLPTAFACAPLVLAVLRREPLRSKLIGLLGEAD